MNIFSSDCTFSYRKDVQNMKKENNNTFDNLKVVDDYDDGNIPSEDLPQDIIPDEVPRKDGPGGEGK